MKEPIRFVGLSLERPDKFDIEVDHQSFAFDIALGFPKCFHSQAQVFHSEVQAAFRAGTGLSG